MIKGKHYLLGEVEIRNEDKQRFESLKAKDYYLCTLKKPQIMVYCDWLKRGKLELDPFKANDLYTRMNGQFVFNLEIPIAEIRVEN